MNSRNSDYSSTWSNSSGQRNRSGSLSVDLNKAPNAVNKPFDRNFGHDDRAAHDARARTMSTSVHELHRPGPQYPHGNATNYTLQHVSET